MLATGLKSLASAAKWTKNPRVLFSTSSRRCSYIDTVDNLKIGAHTRVIFQGFTGRQVPSTALSQLTCLTKNRQATQNAKQSLEYGTQIVGGVTPGQTGEHLGLPVLPSVRAVSVTDCRTIFHANGLTDSKGQGSIETRCNGGVCCSE